MTNNGKRIFQLNPRNGKLDLIGPVKAGEHYAITVEVIDSGGKSSQGKILRYLVKASYRLVLNAIQFLEEFGYKIRNINIKNHSKSFLFQSVGIVIQRNK